MKKYFICGAAMICFATQLSAQNVGIGNTSPVSKLEVSATDSSVGMLSNTSLSLDSTKTRLYFRNNGFYTGAIGTHITSGGTGATVPYARMGFFGYGSPNATGLKEYMSIADNGNVGINTVAPLATLDINGTMLLRGNGAGAGKVLTSDGNGYATWQAAPALTLPYTGSLATNGTLFSVSNTVTSGTLAVGIKGFTASANDGTFLLSGPTGVWGESTPTTSGNFAAGVRGINRGTNNNGYGVIGVHNGGGTGVRGQSESGMAVWGTSESGKGVVGSSNTSIGVEGDSNTGTGVSGFSGSGIAGSFISSTGNALQTSGKVKLTGIGEGTGKVLTSDGAGNATWQNPSGAIGFVGRVTTNTTVGAALFTPTAFTEESDDGNVFNPATGVFTAPSAGLYHFVARASWSTGTNTGDYSFITRINFGNPVTASEQNMINLPLISGGTVMCEANVIRKMAAGEQATLEVGHGGLVNFTLNGGTSAARTTFAGYKVY